MSRCWTRSSRNRIRPARCSRRSGAETEPSAISPPNCGAGPDEPIKSGSLGPLLNRLHDKYAIAFDQPLATRPGNGGKLYRVADSYLRLYLAMLASAREEVKRDRHEQAVPGASEDESGTMVVSRSGAADGVVADVVRGPDDILAAWE